jgi:hypothetical protein
MSENKKYAILIYGTGEEMAALPEAERNAHMKKWEDWVAKMTADGVYGGGDPLNPVAKTIRGKAAVVSDGFFVPKTEHAIGGYIFVEAPSLDAAVEIAKECPTFELDGNVEIREVMAM